MLQNATPNMSGIDWAYDHDWVSSDERQDAADAAAEQALRQDAVLAELDALKAAHPKAMAAAMDNLIGKIHATMAKLTAALAHETNREQKFRLESNHFVLGEVLKALAEYMAGIQPRMGTGWPFRVLYDTLNECNALLIGS